MLSARSDAGRSAEVDPADGRAPAGREHAGPAAFVNQSPWDPLPVWRRIAERLAEVITPEVWVVDDVSFPNRASARRWPWSTAGTGSRCWRRCTPLTHQRGCVSSRQCRSCARCGCLICHRRLG
ncbi:transposase [Streptomyces cinerochromogenes]|uniref:Transposase n=1 Tax=Streptomyces cinerochromogenes TaxID=66422 RepID=A0ABW7B9B6_9ACTN